MQVRSRLSQNVPNTKSNKNDKKCLNTHDLYFDEMYSENEVFHSQWLDKRCFIDFAAKYCHTFLPLPQQCTYNPIKLILEHLKQNIGRTIVNLKLWR